MTKKNSLKLHLMILLTLMFLSCSNDDSIDEVYKQYTGNYKIISFKSNVAVDLNDDNIASKELTEEINSFDLNDLEIRPHEYQSNPVKSISFFFPKTWITFQYPNAPEGSVEFIGYGFLTTYEYVNNSFSLKDNSYIEESYIDNIKSDKNVAINSDLNVIDRNHLNISISKEYYDFNSNDWIMLDIEVIYEKQ